MKENVIRWVTHAVVEAIPFGTISADVLPTAAGPAVGPKITSISKVADDLYELSILGSAETAFAVSASGSLDFENDAVLVTGLTQGDPGDPGSIGGLDNDVVTTDEEGRATFRMTSAAVNNFVRLQPPIAVGP